MKLNINHLLDEIFESVAIPCDDKADHIDLIEIGDSLGEGGPGTFLIIKTSEKMAGHYERSYFAFSTEDEAHRWLDSQGFDLLS